MHPALGNLDTFKSAFAEEVSKVRLVESSIPKLKFRRQLWSRLTKNPALGRTLGAGAFGRVFELKSNRHAVVKIGLENRFDGWFYWAVAAKMLSHNPFMPRIGDIAFGIHFRRGITAAEKRALLKRIQANPAERLKNTNDFSVTGYAVMERLNTAYGDKAQCAATAFWRAANNFADFGENDMLRITTLAKWRKMEPLFKEAARAVDMCNKLNRGRIDLHSGNVMLRKNQVVVTDPIV